MPGSDEEKKLFFFWLTIFSAAVRMARSYSDYLGVKINRLYSPKKNVGEPIPQFPGPAVTSSIVFTNVSKIRCEHVQIVFTSSHPLSTELEVVLTSPSGTQSVLAELHATLVAPSVQVVTTIEGSYTLNGTTAARFGSFPETPVVGSIVHHPNLACNSDMTQSPVASNSYANKIVLVKRGNCSYVEKAVNLANLGCMVWLVECITLFFKKKKSKAVVVYNDVLGSPNVEMSGKPHAVNVPVVMITLLDAQRILNTPGVRKKDFVSHRF
jgi:hypothetical protein